MGISRQQILVSLAALALAGRALASGAYPAHHEVFTPAGLGDPWGFEGRVLDLDGDGRAELVAGLWDNFGDNSYVQIRRFGHSLWEPASVSEIFIKGPANGYVPMAVAAADMNGDGSLDLVVPMEDSLVVLPAVTPGVFGAPIDVAYAPDVGGVAVADFDGDGIQDLATSLYLDRRVRILHGVSPWSFVQVAEFPTHAEPLDVFVRDWNGDGKPDVLVGADTASTVLLNDGAGGFQASEVATWNAQPAGDLNGDGHEDLISRKGVFLGGGDGSFQPVLALTGLASVAVGDLDEDGRLDLIGVTAANPAQMSIQRGRGDGSFEAATYRLCTRGGLNQTLLADLDGDGHVDVAELGRTGTDAVSFGLGNGSFPEPMPVPINSPIRQVKKGEFGSHTGRDFLIVGASANSMGLLHSAGLATWTVADTIALPGTPDAYGPKIGDLNGDGLDDIVIGYTDQQFVSYWLTDSNGHFGPRTDLGINYPALDVALGDIDNDGAADILIQTYSAGLTPPMIWYRNHGNGQFDYHTLPFDGFGSLEIRDLNGDGIPDLAMINTGPPYSYGIAVVLGPIVFGTPSKFWPPVVFFAQKLVVGRFDGDNIPDLALANGAGVWYFHGNGDGSFGPGVGLTGAAAFGQKAYTADLDGDGRDEIVTGTSVTRFKPDGSLDGAFAFAVVAGFGSGASTVLDVDGNGFLDLVGSGSGDLSLRVMLNRAGPQTLGVRPPAGPPSRLALAPTANPCGRSIRVRLASASAERVTVELLDVQGRRLHETVARPVAGGVVEVDLGPAARISPGVYLVLARQGQASAVTRAIVVH